MLYLYFSFIEIAIPFFHIAYDNFHAAPQQYKTFLAFSSKFHQDVCMYVYLQWNILCCDSFHSD